MRHLSTVLRHFEEPDAERLIADEVRRNYRDGNPEYLGAEAIVSEKSEQLAYLKAERTRHLRSKEATDLVRERFFGPRSDRTSLFDSLQFIAAVVAALLGIAMAWTTVANYVAELNVFDRLTDNYIGALLMSAAPVTGAFLLKARASILNNDEAERSYYLRLSGYAFVSLCVYFLALSVVFAPHHHDTAQLADALVNGASLDDPISQAIKAVGPYVVLVSQLMAETLIAPVLLAYASKLHRAGRPITVGIHEQHPMHDEEIDAISDKIEALIDEQVKVQRGQKLHTDTEEFEVGAAIQLFRKKKADHGKHLARASAEFPLIIRGAKPGSR